MENQLFTPLCYLSACFAGPIAIVSLYNAVSRPGFAIPEAKAGVHVTAQTKPSRGGKSAYQAVAWDIAPELETFRAKHQQLLEGVFEPDLFTQIQRGLAPVSSEAGAYGVLAYTHFACCNAVLRTIECPAYITFSTSELYYPKSK